MSMEERGQVAEAGRLFLQAWKEATNDFEKFLAAFFIAREQEKVEDRLKWLEISLQLALLVNDDTVIAAYPSLYANISKCYGEIGEPEKANKYAELSTHSRIIPGDKGPFYHGTKAALKISDLLTPGNTSNYKEEMIMNHIYFTAYLDGAGLAAALAKGDGPERVYIVEPTGSFEHDPNVTNKKFPGNPTRSYRTREPLKIVGEVKEWTRITPGQLQEWQDKLKNNKGEIIN
jgi:rifampin ADP-ribosylating transferase